MKKAIINGGAGFVGSALVDELIEHDVETWAIVREGYSKRKNGRLKGKKVNIIECNLSEIERVPDIIGCFDFDVWYQLAWDGLSGTDLVSYEKQINNIKYVLDSIKVAKKIGCHKYVGSGSISQYELWLDMKNNQGVDKHRIYKAAKYTCEQMGKSVAQEEEIDFIWPIITNIYGCGERSERLVNSMIRKLSMGVHQSLSECNQIYDFIYITDAAKAFRLIGEKGLDNGHYVIAQGDARQLRDFMEIIRKVVSPDAKLGYGEMKFNGYYLDKELYSIEELQKDTGFEAEISYEEGIRRTYNWIKTDSM